MAGGIPGPLPTIRKKKKKKKAGKWGVSFPRTGAKKPAVLRPPVEKKKKTISTSRPKNGRRKKKRSGNETSHNGQQ